MNAISPGFACAAGGMPFEVAQARVLGLVPQPLAAEMVPLEACVGRVLAAPVVARLCLPGFDQSAMDGYAVASTGLMPDTCLPVVGRTAAGQPPARLVPGTVHRILTGAPIPEGADAVIAQECVAREGALIRIGAVPPPGTNLRRRGEDIRADDSLCEAGTRLDWRHVTVLASQGIEAVAVRRRPRVALLSSGRELQAPGQPLRPGQIHDSNLPMLRALLGAWGAEVRPCPVVADEPAAMREALRGAAEAADLVLTTAGISVGDEDHVRDAIGALGGDLTVLKVAMKPGKPLAAGRIGEAAFIGLPGNPQAALAGALAFVRPLLARMAGAAPNWHVTAAASFGLRRKPGRAELLPVRLRAGHDGLRAERIGPDGSGRLSPLLAADGLAYFPAEQQEVQPGDLVDVLLFQEVAHA